ncbi:MAG: hypothetical protein EBV06_11705 [Planctomycetia bacterium]|nr:hypothetical protein [Planctomycetia bacterium]
MIGIVDIDGRLRRLEELTRGLAKEIVLWREGCDPLLYLERKAYLNALQDALAGLESARVALANASRRLHQDNASAS